MLRGASTNQDPRLSLSISIFIYTQIILYLKICIYIHGPYPNQSISVFISIILLDVIHLAYICSNVGVTMSKTIPQVITSSILAVFSTIPRKMAGKFIWLVVSTLLKILVNWDYYFPNIWEIKKCSKPPTSYDIVIPTSTGGPWGPRRNLYIHFWRSTRSSCKASASGFTSKSKGIEIKRPWKVMETNA